MKNKIKKLYEEYQKYLDDFTFSINSPTPLKFLEWLDQQELLSRKKLVVRKIYELLIRK